MGIGTAGADEDCFDVGAGGGGEVVGECGFHGGVRVLGESEVVLRGGGGGEIVLGGEGVRWGNVDTWEGWGERGFGRVGGEGGEVEEK